MNDEQGRHNSPEVALHGFDETESLKNRDARTPRIAVLLWHLGGVARIHRGDHVADALILDAVWRRFVVRHNVPERRIDEERQKVTLPEARHVPTVIEEGRRKRSDAVDFAGMIGSKLQREESAHRETAHENVPALLAQ